MADNVVLILKARHRAGELAAAGSDAEAGLPKRLHISPCERSGGMRLPGPVRVVSERPV